MSGDAHEPVEATLLAATRDAVQLRGGGLTAWIPRSLLDQPSRAAAAAAAIGDRLTLHVAVHKLRDLGWPLRDRHTPDLFG